MKPMIVALALAAGTAGQSHIPTGTTGARDATSATASLIDAQYRPIGEAHLQQTRHGVLLKLNLKKPTPGVPRLAHP
jgi:hypothetical protein